MRNLRNRTALVTGASMGIGVYIARALAAEGMNLILAARSADKLEQVADDIRATGHRVLCIPTDLSVRDSLSELVERAEGEGGGVDVLVNNAGVEDWMIFDQLPVELIDEAIEINLRAPVVLSRLLLPKMLQRGRGHIVNISSLAGLGPVPYAEPYCLTKHGLVGFTRSLRATALSEGYPVSCSVVCPGLVDSGMYGDVARDFGVKAPLALGSSPPERVARAVVRAVKRDLPEPIVNPIPYRLVLAIGLVAPRLAQWMVKWLGISKFFAAIARQRGKQGNSR